MTSISVLAVTGDEARGNKIETRMVSTYGYCYPLGYGFINEVYLKHDLNDYNLSLIFLFTGIKTSLYSKSI